MANINTHGKLSTQQRIELGQAFNLAHAELTKQHGAEYSLKELQVRAKTIFYCKLRLNKQIENELSSGEDILRTINESNKALKKYGKDHEIKTNPSMIVDWEEV